MELWKDIPGFEGRYQASDQGRVRSLPNKVRKSILVLAQQRHVRSGYLLVNLTTHDGKRWRQKCHWVARLIAMTFHGPAPSPLHEACHGDGNHIDNRASNLRWDTPAGNQSDRIAHGTANIGSQNPRAKLNETQVRDIKLLLASTRNCAAIAARYGVAESTIKNIKNGYNWRHIS